MSFNGKYEEKKKAVIALRDEFLNHESLFALDKGGVLISKDKLIADIDSLLEGPFTIAVCGEVKAGKSTLLNSLFFDDNIIPVFETPETAKITFIRQSKTGKDYFEVNFYSKEEWIQLNEEYSQDEKRKEGLSKRLEKSSECGVYEKQCIGLQPRIVENLEDLNQYVSVAKEGDFLSEREQNAGKYTPFVKSVAIYISSEKLKADVQIVDTPGLNDPNIINSMETLDWIDRAHAVMYVTDETGLHEPDFNFIRKFLKEKGPQNRIMVLNKIDCSDDWNSTVSKWRDDGASNTLFRELDLCSEKERICGYSGLVNIVRKKLEKSLPLTENESLNYEEREDFDGDPNNLMKCLEETLFVNEGARRIDSAFDCLRQLVSGKLESIELQKVELETQLGEYTLNSEDKIQKKEKLKKLTNEITTKSKDIDDKLNEYIGQNIKEFYEELKNERNRLQKDSNDELLRIVNDDGNYLQIKAEYPVWLSGKLSERNRNIVQKMNELKKNCQEECKSLITIFVSELNPDQQRVFKDAELRFKNNHDRSKDIDAENLADVMKRTLPSNTFTNLFSKCRNYANTMASEMNIAIKNHWDECYDAFPDRLREEMDELRNRVLQSIKQSVDFAMKCNEDAIKNEQNVSHKLAELNNQLDMLKRERKEFEDLKKRCVA